MPRHAKKGSGSMGGHQPVHAGYGDDDDDMYGEDEDHMGSDAVHDRRGAAMDAMFGEDPSVEEQELFGDEEEEDEGTQRGDGFSEAGSHIDGEQQIFFNQELGPHHRQPRQASGSNSSENGDQGLSGLGARFADRGSGMGARGSGQGPFNHGPQRQRAGGDQGGGNHGGGGGHNAGAPQPQQPNMAPATVRNMPGFDPKHMGEGITSNAPIFNQGLSLISPWQDFVAAGLVNVRPKRSLVLVNIPVKCLQPDATRMTHWATPMENPSRAINIAAHLGLCCTPMSKGWISGYPEEVWRVDQANAAMDAAEEAPGGERPKKKERPKRVRRYLYMAQGANHSYAMPQYVLVYEELYDKTLTHVTFIRIWMHIFDEQFSLSELVRRLMDETSDAQSQAGVAHCAHAHRKENLVKEHKKSRMLAGGRYANAKLETTAGTQFQRIANESTMVKLIPSIGGRTDTAPGRPCVSNLETHLPCGALNQRLEADPDKKFGGTSCLALEFLLNGKREDGLNAGIADLATGNEGDVHECFMQVHNYFDDEDRITVPQEARDKSSYFWLTDPNITNIFDAPLPRPIHGNVTPGAALMELYRDEKLPGMDLASPSLLDHFNNTMTGTDQITEKLIKSLQESITTYDTSDVTDAERVAVDTLRCYGEKHDGDMVVEPPQALKGVAHDTTKVFEKVVAPWSHRVQMDLEKMNISLRTGANHSKAHVDLTADPMHFSDLVNKRDEYNKRFSSVMKELGELHLKRIEQAFTSRVDSETIPAGFRACWNGLMKELDDMPNGTANVAFGIEGGNQMMDSDRTVFGQLMDWINRFFEDDCFIDGRDWRHMQELLVHCFEQYGPKTLLAIFCGPKGNGKTMRTERLAEAFVPGWVVMSGPASAKEGMNGDMGSDNGCNRMYDEMMDELTDGDGGNRTEYWKQILLKREYIYNRTVPVMREDGTTVQKSVKLKTPHQETHAVMTNRGAAFTKGKEEPTEVKSALIDRAIVSFVRTLTASTRSDDEFRAHLQTQEARRRLRMFRILTCVTGITKMAIYRQPHFMPDMAYAQRVWDFLDKQLVDAEYSLPTLTPRKNEKRLENCITYTVMNAVAHRFFFKQTAHHSNCGSLDESGECKPFDIKQLWECIELLQPTPEIICFAWQMSLEYATGTSAFALNAITAACEVFGFTVSDYFRNPPDSKKSTESMSRSAEQERARAPVEHVAADDDYDDDEAEVGLGGSGRKKKKRGAGGGSRHFASGPAARAENAQNPIFTRMINKKPELLDNVIRRREQLSVMRKQRAAYRNSCHQSTHRETHFKDPAKQIGEICCGLTVVPEEVDAEMQDQAPDEEAVEDVDAYDEADEDAMGERAAWHEENAKFYPGAHNCRIGHWPGHCAQADPDSEDKFGCPYCMVTEEDLRKIALEEKAKQGARRRAEAELKDQEEKRQAAADLAVAKVQPTLLEASMFYADQSLVQWCVGKPISVEDVGNTTTGTKKGLHYRERGGKTDGGSADYDLAWFSNKHGRTPTGEGWNWHSFAVHVHRNSQGICKMFDFHVDGLKDIFYLSSTKDNERRCPDEPVVPPTRGVSMAFKEDSGGRQSGWPSTIEVSPIQSGSHPTHGEMDSDRPDGSRVDKSEMQRQADWLLQEGRLRAVDILSSNRITMAPPIRLMEGAIELNAGAMMDHLSLVAECMLRCANVPGLRNRQEKFCRGSQGLEGTQLSAGGSKKRSQEAPENPETAPVDTIPFSYDIVAMGMTIDALGRFYDPMKEKHVKFANEQYGQMLGLNLNVNDLPQTSTRYVGYSETNRQTITVNVPFKKPETQKPHEVGQSTVDGANVSVDHVARALGREATEEDHTRYVAAREGARNMKGVEGDLLSYETWIKHATTALKSRGIVAATDMSDPVVQTFCHMTTCINARILEHACEKQLPGYKHLNIIKARPMSFAAVERRQKEEEQEQEKARERRASKKHLQAVDTLDFSRAGAGLVPIIVMPPQRPAPRSDAGPSGQDDDMEVERDGDMHDVRES